MQPRSIVKCVVLSYVTLGIYSLWWMYKLNDETATGANKPPIISGGLLIVLSLVTFGIFLLYWCYKQGEYVTDILSQHGQQAGNLPVLYLILGIFTGGVVTNAFIQNEINKLVL